MYDLTLAGSFLHYHLYYALNLKKQFIHTVKVHGVFPCSWEECRIFTASSISLRQSWRQWRSRYTIHAGRNLPAKEFRYLRTVRVTAAVYLYLNFARKRLTFMDRHRAGLRPNTSFINFAESCVFTKQSLPPFWWYH